MGTLDAPKLDPSPYTRVGTIVQVDPDSSTVVVLLEERAPSLPEELLVRDDRRDIKARLRPTGIRTGRSLGMVLVQGQALAGEEVVKINTP